MTSNKKQDTTPGTILRRPKQHQYLDFHSINSNIYVQRFYAKKSKSPYSQAIPSPITDKKAAKHTDIFSCTVPFSIFQTNIFIQKKRAIPSSYIYRTIQQLPLSHVQSMKDKIHEFLHHILIRNICPPIQTFQLSIRPTELINDLHGFHSRIITHTSNDIHC